MKSLRPQFLLNQGTLTASPKWDPGGCITILDFFSWARWIQILYHEGSRDLNFLIANGSEQYC